MDYYTEIDAVELSGNVVNVEEETQHNQQLLNEGFDTEVTTKLMKQLSINENDDTAIGCLSDNGYFDLLPVSFNNKTNQGRNQKFDMGVHIKNLYHRCFLGSHFYLELSYFSH